MLLALRLEVQADTYPKGARRLQERGGRTRHEWLIAAARSCRLNRLVLDVLRPHADIPSAIFRKVGQ